jgi:hypothetical protein
MRECGFNCKKRERGNENIERSELVEAGDLEFDVKLRRRGELFAVQVALTFEPLDDG